MAFRLGSIDGRAVLVVGDHVYDVEKASGGEIEADPLAAVAAHRALGELSAEIADGSADDAGAKLPGSAAAIAFDAPVPRPGSVFAVGLNYRPHAEESGLDLPTTPLVFTKFVGCITGPDSEVALNSEHADYEVELVVVIGTEGFEIEPDDAWSHVAGITVGNDISDRKLQFAAQPPHFSLGKSRNGYGPIGPVIVSVDAFDDPNNIGLTCSVNGELRQDDRSSNLIFDVPYLINYLSSIVTLRPGDLIFTGTPAGVGMADQKFLQPGDTVVCSVEGVGSIETRCT